MSFERVQRIADAVLLEGYVLYPYRADSTKNQYRWTFGVVAPRSWSEAGGSDPYWIEARVLVAGDAPRLRARLRFLAIVDRRVEAREGDAFRPTERLDVGGSAVVAWEEGEIRELDFDLPTPGADAHDEGIESVAAFSIDRAETVEVVRDGERIAGRIIRVREPLHGIVRMRVEGIETPRAEDPLWRVTIRVENHSAGVADGAPRAMAMRGALASTHLIVAAHEGRFLSLHDPPAHAKDAAESCRSVGSWPVLAGDAGRDDLVLCSPLILYDHPEIAPESTGDFFDATEIDELLALRTRTLTPAERVVARGTDARAAAVLDRALAMTDEELARLHGAIRDRPRTARVYAPGARVRLRTDSMRRRTDAQDILYAGRTATVHAVKKDVDGRDYLAVTIDDDPAAELHAGRGIYRYYYPDEVEELGDPGAGRPS